MLVPPLGQFRSSLPPRAGGSCDAEADISPASADGTRPPRP